jgi:hypothetical protein
MHKGLKREDVVRIKLFRKHVVWTDREGEDRLKSQRK